MHRLLLTLMILFCLSCNNQDGNDGSTDTTDIETLRKRLDCPDQLSKWCIAAEHAQEMIKRFEEKCPNGESGECKVNISDDNPDVYKVIEELFPPEKFKITSENAIYTTKEDGYRYAENHGLNREKEESMVMDYPTSLIVVTDIDGKTGTLLYFDIRRICPPPRGCL